MRHCLCGTEAYFLDGAMIGGETYENGTAKVCGVEEGEDEEPLVGENDELTNAFVNMLRNG